MSMYNMIFGENQYADVILATLGLTRASVGRFRNCYVSEGKIAVYTRNGGGNRQCWDTTPNEHDSEKCSCPGCIITHRLPKHPNYLEDNDDLFDSTYATIYFSIPEEFADLKLIDIGKWDPSNEWLVYLDRLKKVGPTEEERKQFQPLVDEIQKALKGKNT